MTNKPINKPQHTDMQLLIGWVLRGGVFLSICLVVFGGVIYLIHDGHHIAGYATFKGVPDIVRNIGGIAHSVMALKGRTIMQVGLSLLIATPIIRVAFSAIVFISEKDYLYTGITLLVLLIILSSMISGYAG